MSDKLAIVRELIQDADMVLVGIGEEFEPIKELEKNPAYIKMRMFAESKDQEWMIPVLNQIYTEPAIQHALQHLAQLLQNKNYFIVTSTTNDIVWNCGFKMDRITAPCGGSNKKQCSNPDCKAIPTYLSEEDNQILIHWLQPEKQEKGSDFDTCNLGICNDCSSQLILNNIYTQHYNEEGYLDSWSRYTKWVQGTMNRKLCILELGVGMLCPSVIRFPFEKMGFFNKKASFVRVNHNLYQLTEELKEKGVSISENAVDFTASL